MKKELNELLAKWEENGPQRQFIRDAYEILLSNERDLIPYINDFQIIFFYEPRLGSFNNKKRILSINYSSLSDKWIEANVKNRKVLAIIVLKHELEHVRQLKNLYEGKQDLESLITSSSLKDFALESHLLKEYHPREYLWDLQYLKKENYEIDPCERLADIRSWTFIQHILEKEARPEYPLSIKRLDTLYQKGYQNSHSPTYQFFENLGLLEELDHIKEEEEKVYDDSARTLYGLPKVKTKKKV